MKSIFVILVAFLLFTSCKKDEKEVTPTPTNTTQTLDFHWHTNVDTLDVAYGVEFRTASGRKFNISDLRYYVSNFVLIKKDGTSYPIPETVFLINPNNRDYSLGKVPVGEYKGFTFQFGIDSARNHMDPTTYSASNPLSIQSPNIHWDWNPGYIFLKLEGKVDTTAAANGTANFDYFYHVGLDANRKTVDFSNSPFTIVSGSDKEIHFEFDLLKALANVDMRIENATHSMGPGMEGMQLATKIANNMVDAFDVE